MDCDNLPHVYICVLYKAETRAMGLSCCAGIRATVSALLWLCPAKKDRSAPTGIQKAWRTVAIAARVALPLIVLNWFGMPAFAQDATWLSTPSTSVFNTPSNWIGGVVPTGTATFNTSSQTNITFLAPPFTATVQTLMFNAPGYTFALAFPPRTYHRQWHCSQSGHQLPNLQYSRWRPPLHQYEHGRAGVYQCQQFGQRNIQSRR